MYPLASFSLQQVGEGLVLGGPEAPGAEERFTTVARAANARESTPLEMKSESCRLDGWSSDLSAQPLPLRPPPRPLFLRELHQ